MFGKHRSLLLISLLAAFVAGPGGAGVPQGEPIARQPDAPLVFATREPVVLAQIAPGTGDSEAVADAGNAPPEQPGLLMRLKGFLIESYRREPVLMIALGLVVLLSPVVSMLLFATQSAKRVIVQRRTMRGEALKHAMQAAATSATTIESSGPDAWRAEAALEFVDEDYDPLPLRGPMLRIGRHEENDVLLADKTVHRHHAVLQLTGDQGYTITDLSGAEGNGVLVNAERVTQARLRHGDIIELGAVKLRFALNADKTSSRLAGQTQVTLH
jgi:hypothetical protein